MDSAASIPIFHRDIKSSNILLDDKFSAKISDLGTSVTVPFDKAPITTAVPGTFGDLDPEYFQSNPQVEAEAKRDDVFAAARLAKSCLGLNGKEDLQ
ncbi:hypothetical protein POTOM_059100 [Populus tomentosa]|uniref:Protein kinase domain-containing protein n=1 Tax=Populus tomentosa TaxID=118781 RepID=A0A8X8C197_POPTO|nr:hypothetical protein POTOM_059100 [Populus tomentosa]